MQRRSGQTTLRIESLEMRRLLSASDWTAEAEGEGDDLVADFSLLDVNPTSATYNQNVSPRDYLGKVSAWYFGHAT